MLNDREIEALTISVLAVGLWPSERVREALPRFRDAGLLVPAAVASIDLGELTVKLANNGYNRGLLTSMYAERVQAVMREITSGQLDSLSSLVAAGHQAEFVVALKRIHGVGPKVAATAWQLMVALGR